MQYDKMECYLNILKTKKKWVLWMFKNYIFITYGER